MVNLPRRTEKLTVEIDGTDAVLHIKPMSEAQQVQAIRVLEENLGVLSENGGAPRIRDRDGGWYEIVEGDEVLDKVQGRENAQKRLAELAGTQAVTVDTDELEAVEAMLPMLAIVEENIRGADNVQIEGEPFDAEDEGHVEAIPMGWKMQCVRDLVEESFMTQEAEKG